MRDLPIYTRYMELQQELRKAHQEMQQWEDETDLEVETLHDIIDGQQEHIKELQDLNQDAALQSYAQQGTIEAYKLELERLRSQLNAAYERNLKQGFALSAAQQEIAALKHSHADACEMKRRLCLALESAEKENNLLEARANDHSALYEDYQRLHLDIEACATQRRRLAEDKRQLFDALQQAEAKAAGFEKQFRELQAYAQAVQGQEQEYALELERLEKESADAKEQTEALHRWGQKQIVSLLDQLQAAEAKLEWLRQNQPHAYDFMKYVIPGQSAPTPPAVNIDWTTAPKWADYHAFDGDNKGYWYEHKPRLYSTDSDAWRQSDYGGSFEKNNYILPNGLDWTESLTQRPQTGGTVPPRPMWSRYRSA